MVMLALREHRRLRRLFSGTKDLLRNLSLIEEELKAHIRYEERVLSTRCSGWPLPAQLSEVERLHHGQLFVEDWGDRFWE